MTMRLVIKNEDKQRTAVVQTVDGFNDDKVCESVESAWRIAPGEQAEFYIHAGRSLKITELQEE